MWFEKISYVEAEKIENKRLDRRRQYYKHTKEGATVDNGYACNGSGGSLKGDVFVIERWTQPCSGCSEYDAGHCIYEAGGCHECGYTGKRREWMHMPINLQEAVNDLV